MFVAQVADDRAPDRPQAAVERRATGAAEAHHNGTESDFQIADLIEFNRLKPRISNRQRITGHGVPCPEMVFGVSALPYAEKKFSGFSPDAAAYR